MGLLGRAVLIILTLPFVVGLYVGGTKPDLIREAFVAYNSTGVLGIISVVLNAPDVLAVAGLVVVVVVFDLRATDRSQ